MEFRGKNKLNLSDESISTAIEDALNSGRLPGESRIRILDLDLRSYSGPSVTITTDDITVEDKAAGGVQS